MFKEIFLSFIKDTILIPLVISKRPVKTEAIIFDGMSKKRQTGSSKIHTKSVIPLTFKMEIITENKTTNPPIIRMVEMADWILVPSTSPKFETVIF